MNPFPWSDVLVIAGLILLNGLFAMSELAIVSARPARLRLAAERGSSGAKMALTLASDPGKLLSTAQIGITLIGIVAGAFSGEKLGGPIGEELARLGMSPEWAPEIGFVVAIAATTYFSLVVGELVPKQVALRAAEPIATYAAPAMILLAKVTAPMVWLLNRSSGLLLRLIGVSHKGEHSLSAEELQMIFAEATRSGAIEEDERQIMTGIMRLADRPVREVMTPRIELDTIDRKASEDEIRAAIKESPHSLLPVADGSPDNIVGVVKVKDVLAVLLAGRKVSLPKLMRKAEIVPDQLDAMDALRMLQQSGVAMALVHDEYGHLEGIVTPADLLSAIVGNFASYQDEGDEPLLTVREDGSLLMAGALPVDALIDRLGLDLPDDRDYATAAGYALSVLKRLPHEGEHFTEQDWRFEVVDMDGRKIDKLLVSRAEDKKPSAEAAA
ncbi:MAG: hemolysin family protein [Novosphingobium sp.]